MTRSLSSYRAAAWIGALGLMLASAAPAVCGPRLGGPGPHGGFTHAGTAMNVHAPGGPGFHGGGVQHEPGPHPGPGPGPGPHPPGPGPGPGPRPPPPPPPPAWWGWDNDPFWNYPIATAAAVGVVAGTAAAVTSAALGETTYALPSNCVTVFQDSLTYFHCGAAWYQPQYLGSGVTYVAVAGP